MSASAAAEEWKFYCNSTDYPVAAMAIVESETTLVWDYPALCR